MKKNLLVNAKKMLKVSAIVLMGAIAISESGSLNAMMRPDEHPDPEYSTSRLEDSEANRAGAVLNLNDMRLKYPGMRVAREQVFGEIPANLERDFESHIWKEAGEEARKYVEKREREFFQQTFDELTAKETEYGERRVHAFFMENK